MGEPAERAGWRSEPVRQGKQAQGDQGRLPGHRCGKGCSGDTRRRAHARTHALHVCRCRCAHTHAHKCAHTCAPVYTWPHALADALAHGKDGAAPRTRCLVPLASFLGGRDEVPAGAREDGSPPPLPHAGPQLRRVFGAGALCADGPEPLEQPGAPAVTVVSELAE